MFTFKAVNIAEKSPCSCKLEQFTFMFVIKLTAGALVHKHKVESMKPMMHECTQPWSHIVSFIIHKIDYWQVQVGAKSSTAPEKCNEVQCTESTQSKCSKHSRWRRGVAKREWHCSGHPRSICGQSQTARVRMRARREGEVGGGGPGVVAPA